MANPYKRPESILLIIYTRCQHVLLLKRSDHACFWQSVTGSMEWSEHSQIQTAQRELIEETGLRNTDQIKDMAKSYRYKILPQWRHRYAPGVTENIEHVFSLMLPQPVSITIDSKEHCSYQWLPITEAAHKATSWSNRDAIIQLRSHLMQTTASA